jgi:cation transport ATPase
MIIGDDIKDTYGSRVGYAIGGASDVEKAAAGLLLFGLKPAATASSPSSSSSSDYSGYSSGYEDNAGYGRSLDDDPNNPLMQAAQGFVSSLLSGLSPEEVAKFAAKRARVLKESEDKEREERWKQESEAYESAKKLEEEERKKREEERKKREERRNRFKKAFPAFATVVLLIADWTAGIIKKQHFWFIFRTVLGGIIGVFLFAVLPSLGSDFAVMVSAGILAVVMAIFSKIWWFGLICGIVGKIISFVIGSLVMEGLSLPVAILIGFILGALIVKMLKYELVQKY